MADKPSESYKLFNKDQLWQILWQRFPQQWKNLNYLEKKLQYCFRNKQLLYEAMTHKSVLSADFKALPWNERLEFLGDAVLSLSVSSLLWRELDDQVDEGVLSRKRASLVSEASLASIAKEIMLGDCLLVSRSEKTDAPQNLIRDSLLADGLEALLGAIYLDADFNTVCLVIHKLLTNRLSEDFEETYCDYKTQLQEIVQAKTRLTPSYEDVSAQGPDHNKTFKVAVTIKDKRIAVGSGSSKKRASQEAAKKALIKLQNQESEILVNV